VNIAPIPQEAAYALLQDAAERDRTTARRAALTEILWHERWLGRGALMERTAQRLGSGCFGESAWEDTFNRDINAVREALSRAGADLAYSRTKGLDGYYLRGQGRLHPDIVAEIARQIVKIDLRQLGIYRALGLPQRVRQALKASEQAAWEARYQRGERRVDAAAVRLAEFMRSVIQALQAAGMAYAVSGSAAGWAWGEPRPLLQMDILVLLDNLSVAVLVERLRDHGLTLPDSKADVWDKTRHTLRIDVTYPSSVWRARLFIPPPADKFFHAAVSRAVELDYGREIGALNVLTAEYLALWELYRYAQERGEEHLRAAAAVVCHQRDELARDVIHTQAERYGWQRLWEEVLLHVNDRLAEGS
jgi:hypothetical protein